MSAMSLTSNGQPSLRNVVVAGETGVGKSSFINLVVDSDSATTGNDVSGVTTRASKYVWKTDEHAFCLWDTPGLGEDSCGVDDKDAQRILRSLLRQLGKIGNVHLLVICMRGIARVTASMQRTYTIVHHIWGKVSPETPIVAVITEMERQCKESNIIGSMEEWWSSHEGALAKFGMTFQGHACLTTLADDCHPPIPGRRAKCQTLARDLLVHHSLPFSTPVAPGKPTGFSILNYFPKPSHNTTRNIVIVGETVEKGAIINLVIGSDSVVTDNDVSGVTIRPSEYVWKTDRYAFRLWDTPGFGEDSPGNASDRNARYVLRLLLRELSNIGGVHLLVICMRGFAGATKSMERTYKIIRHILDKVSPKTPVVAVITEMEKQCKESDIVGSMEEWWSSRKGMLAGMTFQGHACLTTVADNHHPPMLGRRVKCQTLARNLLIDHSLSSDRSMSTNSASRSSLLRKLTWNIVVVGEACSGKSSIINLVVGADSAVASSYLAVTGNTSYHDWSVLEMQKFRLWDTSGLGDGSGSTSPNSALDALRSLLTELTRGAGVHLIIMCFNGQRVISNFNYDAVVACRNRVCPDTPLVAVVTGLEGMSDPSDPLAGMDQWWHAKEHAIYNGSMTVNGHACITTLLDNETEPPMPGRRDDCRHLVQELIIDHALTPRIISPQDIHIVLFGEPGVGKSSLVNLLAGRSVAEVSSDIMRCTLASTEYQFQLGPVTIRLWDTVGLQEPMGGSTNEYMDAVEKAVELIRQLNASGGISLFLFCIRADRVTMTMQKNYRLFYEMLGRKRVPIALVVTHLEREQVMEAWWSNNVEALKEKGIVVREHACITALEGHPKSTESRQALQKLFWNYVDQEKYSVLSEAWLRQLLGALSKLWRSKPKRQALVRTLTERCRLEQDVAERVADGILRGSTGERVGLESFANQSAEGSESGGDGATVKSVPKSAPPRPSSASHDLKDGVDNNLVDWANSHLPRSLQMIDPASPLFGGLALLRLAEDIMGKSAPPLIPDSVFPSGPNDDKSDGLFRLFGFLLDNDVELGAVSINDVRQGKQDKVMQLVQALKAWENRRKEIIQGLRQAPLATAGP